VTDPFVLTRRDPDKPLLVAILGPTATGKSTLALALAERFRGEIVNCDSTAVYRGFDIGTDKVPPSERRRIPHHLLDVAEPTEPYTVARYAADAARVVRGIVDRDPGPGADAALRARLERIADRRGVAFLHRMVRRIDPASGVRILPRDRRRLVRALEVYFLTGRPLTSHFADTVSPLGFCDVVPIGLRIPAALTSARVTRRVDEQFARGLMHEVRTLLASGVPDTARPFGGLVYRQAIELLHGVRDEPATRALIAQENRRYARRQLIWFRKEPNLVWLDGPGELPSVIECASRAMALLVEPHG
jgi:tRNA dimethylallyltransferase